MERYEFDFPKRNTFWEFSVTGATVTVRTGEVGTQGRTQEITFASDVEGIGSPQISSIEIVL